MSETKPPAQTIGVVGIEAATQDEEAGSTTDALPVKVDIYAISTCVRDLLTEDGVHAFFANGLSFENLQSDKSVMTALVMRYGVQAAESWQTLREMLLTDPVISRFEKARETITAR